MKLGVSMDAGQLHVVANYKNLARVATKREVSTILNGNSTWWDSIEIFFSNQSNKILVPVGTKSITNIVGQKQIGTQQLTAIETKSPAAIMQGGAQAGKVDGTGAGYRYGELTDGRD